MIMFMEYIVEKICKCYG